MTLDIANAVRQEFPAVVGNPGRDFIFADAPTGTQVPTKIATQTARVIIT